MVDSRIVELIEAEIRRKENLAIADEVFEDLHMEVADALQTVLDAYLHGNDTGT